MTTTFLWWRNSWKIWSRYCTDLYFLDICFFVLINLGKYSKVILLKTASFLSLLSLFCLSPSLSERAELPSSRKRHIHHHHHPECHDGRSNPENYFPRRSHSGEPGPWHRQQTAALPGAYQPGKQFVFQQDINKLQPNWIINLYNILLELSILTSWIPELEFLYCNNWFRSKGSPCWFWRRTFGSVSASLMRSVLKRFWSLLISSPWGSWRRWPEKDPTWGAIIPLCHTLYWQRMDERYNKFSQCTLHWINAGIEKMTNISQSKDASSVCRSCWCIRCECRLSYWLCSAIGVFGFDCYLILIDYEK